MFIELKFIIILTCLIFLIGLIGIIVNRKNIIMILLSIEIVLLAVNLNFAMLSIYLDDMVGHIFVIFILTIAAAESAIGLSLITCLYQLKNSIEIKPIQKKYNKI
jgi:NADH-quinone oxidoreductase subunit K